MGTVLRIYPHDDLNRRVLFAVEIFDPIMQTLVSRRVRVEVEGLKGRPIVNRSGRFVWLFENDAWPVKVSVVPEDARFDAVTVQALPRPNDIVHATERERLMRIALQPTRVYDFGEGATAIRGLLTESLERGASPVTDAIIGLAWASGDEDWQPPGSTVRTDQKGQFAVFLRLPRQPKADLERGLLRVRLEVARPNQPSKATNNFPFLGGPDDPRDRVPEGLLLYRDVKLGWAELQASNN